MRSLALVAGSVALALASCATSQVDAVDPGAPPSGAAPSGATDPTEPPSLDVDASAADSAAARDGAGPSRDASVGGDAGTGGATDAATDTGASGSDAGGVLDASADAALVCAPASVAGFQPMWKAPKTNILACLPSEVDGFYTACLGPASTSQTCQTFSGASGACYACIVSFEADAQWGPLVVYSAGPLGINIGGCVDVAAPSANACARAVQGEAQCEHRACDAACVGAPDATYGACLTSASQGGCATYAANVNTQCASVPGTAAPCTTGSTFELRFKSVARVFCSF